MFKLITFLLVLFLLAGITGPASFAQGFDIDDIIDIQTEDDVAAIREELVGFLFGKDGFPDNVLPDSVTEKFYDRDFEGMKNLKQITRLTMEMEWGLNSIAYLFECCFSGTGYKSYEHVLISKIEQLGQGSFSVILDSSHKEHKISELMNEQIINILKVVKQ